MGLFDFFRGSSADKPKITFGFRREGIVYSVGNREAEIDFTWVDGDRIYTDSITRWTDGEPISDEDKQIIFADVLKYVSGRFRKTIIVINTDDVSSPMWKRLCSEYRDRIKDVEYTSKEQNRQVERQMYLRILNSQGQLVINDFRIHNEEELDVALEKIYQNDSV